MSRQIVGGKDHSALAVLKPDTDGGKLLLTRYRGKPFAFLIKENRLVEAQAFSDVSDENAELPAGVGSIYLGKVRDKVTNLEACFVEIEKGETVFLPMREAKQPFLTNRKYDGRILQGDEFPVQIVREALKTKAAAATCRIKMENPCFVLAVGDSKVSFSHKLREEQIPALRQWLEAEELLEAGEKLRQTGQLPTHGLVVRTRAAELIDEPDKLREAFWSLQKAFSDVFLKGMHRNAFTCLKSAADPVRRVVEAFGSQEYTEIVTDIPEYADRLKDAEHPVRRYTDQTFPLSKLYSLETKLAEALCSRVWLPSGGNLIIEQTECLTTIDVNTAKQERGKESEETFLHVNREAAQEAARQLRLRNLSGIIIIDFINMKSAQAQNELLAYLRALVADDPVKVRVVDITPLGLVEITRRKIYKSLREQVES